MDVLQVIVYLLGGLTAILVALAGLIKLFGTITNRAIERESAARDALEKELRADIAEERTEREKAQRRIAELENERQKDKDQIETANAEVSNLRNQVSTMVTQVGQLQAQVEAIQAERDEERAERTCLQSENKEKDRTIDRLYKSNELLQAEVAAYQKAFTWLGIERSEAQNNAFGPGESTHPEPEQPVSEKTPGEEAKPNQ